MKTREEMFNYVFDILEELDLVNWTKIYNRKDILEAFSQTNVSPYKFYNKKTDTFSKAMINVFGHKDLLNNKGKKESWDIFLLRLINYKKCIKCHETQLFDYFSMDRSVISGLQNTCKKCFSVIGKKYREENKEIIKENAKIYYEENKEIIKENAKIYYEENKESTQERNNLNKLYIVEKLGGKCSCCGYNTNLSALDIHHKIRDPENFPWTIDSNKKNRYPSNYLVQASKGLMIYRFEREKHNLELLCKNCHQKEEFTSIRDSSKGLKESLSVLNHVYKCAICDEIENLQLHHNNPEEKMVSFSHFSQQSRDRILKDGLLEIEMKKDVSILCGNHHQEIHNPSHKIGVI